jgi:hypothetical protein
VGGQLDGVSVGASVAVLAVVVVFAGLAEGFPALQRMTGSMLRAPTGSAHHQPNSSCRPTPASRASDRYEHT